MGQQQNWFFGVVNNFAGEKRLVVKNQSYVVVSRNVFRPDDGEFVPGDFAAEGNVLDATSWN